MKLELAISALNATQHLLIHHGVKVKKAIDPLDPRGFLRIVARLSQALQGVTVAEEKAAIDRATQAMDVDWRKLRPKQREQVIERARQALGSVPGRVMPRVSQEFSIAGPEVAKAAREGSITRFGLAIGTALSQRDLEAEKFIRANAANFITDEYGVRRDELVGVAREIVAQGIAEGTGSAEIASRLHQQLGDRMMRSESYWSVVAMSFANQARTFSQLNAYADAGIQKYSFEAILDEVTTDQCRFYHGKVFSVGAGIAAAQRLMQAQTPEEVKQAAPWIRQGRDDDGNRILYVQRGEEREVVAQVDRSGMGARDDVGEYSKAMDTKQLEGLIPWPPLHGHCRSTIVPEFS